MRLRDIDWRCKYTPADGDLLHTFYVPVLRRALRYDRTTGFYSAQTLAAALDGVEALAINGGKMRLIVGCTLDEAEVEAIRKGEELRDTVEAKLLASPFAASDPILVDALELLAWLVARDYLEIKVAVPCDRQTRLPHANGVIFHEKAGIVEDEAGDRLVFNGSLNETMAGWQSRNWDSFHVFCSWKDDARHLNADAECFARLWADREPTALVVSIGEAVKRRLLEFLPANDALPRRLAPMQPEEQAEIEPEMPAEAEIAPERPQNVWDFIRQAPANAYGGEWVGEATAAVIPWPHQRQAFKRMYGQWPPRLLIADEVGLGKTIQAGLLIRQAWLAGRARRILILAPKAVLWQWQLELREKFNLNFPVYDDGKLRWYPSPVLSGGNIKVVEGDKWRQEPFLLASSQLVRRPERARQLLEAEPWDLLILDEAHHARRRGSLGETARDVPKDVPNQLLRLMRKLKDRVRGLILLTATPMQINPVEVWDLLNLLGLPPGWTAANFLEFFHETAHPAPSDAMLAHASMLFRAVEASFGPLELDAALRLAGDHSRFDVKRVLKALRDEANTPRKRLDVKLRRLAMKLMRQHNPIRMLVSRHTRELLRAYRKSGKLASNIATRAVEDIMAALSPRERALYEAVEDYISGTYNQAAPENRSSVGFVMTIYRRRLASSFFALEQTLRHRLDLLAGKKRAAPVSPEDLPEDELSEEMLQEEEAAKREKEALRAEEAGEIGYLLAEIKKLPADSKAAMLFERIEGLRAEGHEQVIVFTQYTDTLDFLRQMLVARQPQAQVLCFSGRGGERWHNGQWRAISRDRTKEIFRQGQAEIMFCTDAAAEGLNFQFCGALINYDMPWNPMKVEQRIGRIDRLGQKYEMIKIVNFMYANTVEADIYQALRQRISLFGAFVGKLQPILARLPKTIGDLALAGARDEQLDAAIQNLRQDIAASESSDFDLDEIGAASLDADQEPQPAYDLDWLEKILADPALLPPGYAAEPLTSHTDYKYWLPGRAEPVRVTCDRDFYSGHAESVELWSPGSPAFPG